jgi:preprotein translocase SecE subunit
MANSTAAKVAQKAKGDSIFAKMWKFIRESYIETRYKSAWPTWTELRSFTLVVIFAVLVVGCWISGLDILFKMILNLLGH